MKNKLRHLNFTCLKTSVVWVFLLFFVTLFSQNTATLKLVIESKISVKERIVKIDSLINALEKKESDSLHFFYHDYAYWLYKIKEKKEAIFYEKKALNFAKNQNANNLSFIQKILFDLGYYYRKNNQILSAIKTFNEVLKINNKNRQGVLTYNELGLIYKSIHDYYKALDHFEQFLLLSQEDNTLMRKRLLTLNNSINVLLSIKSDEGYQKAILYATEAEAILQKIKIPNRSRYFVNLSIASLYNQNEILNIPKSLKYYDKALRIAEESKDSSKIRDIYIGKGNLFNTTDPDRSIEFQSQALKITDTSDNVRQYQIYFNIGFCYGLKKEYKKAIEHTHKGLEYLIGKDFKIDEDSNVEILIQSKYKDRLLRIFPQLAELYLKNYEATEQVELLDKSIRYFKLADFVIDILKVDTREFRSRLFWRKLGTDIYGKAIRACYLSNNPEQAFYFMEKNKALLLMEDITLQKLTQRAALPGKVLEKDRLYKEQYFKTQNLLKNRKLERSPFIDSLKRISILQERQIKELQDSIGITYSEPKIYSLKSLRDQINDKEVIVEFHVSVDDGYGIYTNMNRVYSLFISKDNVDFFETSNTLELRKDIRTLLPLCKKPITTRETEQLYHQLSLKVFETLFPERIRKKLKKKKVRLIPDSYLSFIPFEALSTSEQLKSYLIKDSEISYWYSYSFLKNNDIKVSDKNTFLGLAPKYFKDTSLPPLLNSDEEVKILEKYFDGELLLGNQASKSNFINSFSNHNIIHLATHTDVEIPTPWISFKEEKLTLEELYLLRNNASLVVLSGCNTTLGEQEIGEGVRSLARGFFYSGSKSVVSTLWSIDDQSTSFIIQSFYNNLSKGQTKSSALHNAKVKYLESHSFSEASPHFWASFILLGEDDTLQNDSTFSLWWLLIGILLISASIIFIKRFF
ncbi:CHAT domain-containing protein [Aquimarina sp. 2201CG5-10]|uniref:CHAT domain-containing protein n=1 Tax=Aquimarina callyspongiae TaxID=3098150 RepID=UPI002AB47625|nr:CHAT domain-containing protein [Aquimarina sp. 2201CG5-10]MDY8138107.1 CHAT domain-containing protein [Aquimarina sp. 2201CG5-10]